MEEISEEVRACIRKRKVNSAAEAGGKQIKQRNKQTCTERTGDFVSFSSLLDIGGGKSIWKFDSVLIAASACIGSNYYQHASWTSNNTIPLLMTEMKRTPVNIIQFHPCTVCCSEKSNEI